MKTSNRKKQHNNSQTWYHYTASEIITIQSCAEKIASIDQRMQKLFGISNNV